MENLNWYPGHMKKTREMIEENLKLVDILLEVVDARIPVSGRNPILDEILGRKNHILLLNKIDVADEAATSSWIRHFAGRKIDALPINGRDGQGIKSLMRRLDKYRDEKLKSGNKKPFRIMIVGVPNSGKSSLINRLSGKKSVAVGDIPGFTKGKQWVTLENKMQLLDTPGILWPKFEDPKVGLDLAFCGSIKDEIMDIADLAFELIKVLTNLYPELLKERYGLKKLGEDTLDIMDQIALSRGLILPGKRIDYERTGRMIMDEFRSGTIGRITLEHVSGREEQSSSIDAALSDPDGASI